VIHENRDRDNRSYGRFKDNNSGEKGKYNVNCVSEELTSDEEAEVCVVEWVDTPRDKLIA
jgi:hypothetical protein